MKEKLWFLWHEDKMIKWILGFNDHIKMLYDTQKKLKDTSEMYRAGTISWTFWVHG